MNIDKNPWTDLIISMDEAIEQASKVMTIRQGDMIVIDRNMASRQLDREEVIQITENEEELLFCKIK
jgi:hypothetical protein